MSPLLRILYLSYSLTLLCSAYPNLSSAPETTAPASLERSAYKSISTSSASTNENRALVGWYTTTSNGIWSINTCGEGNTWSTSGSYGACAPGTSSSLYTGCSGHWLVGGNATSSFSQECVSAWNICTALYVAANINDTSPVTYMICDVSKGFSRRSVFATTTLSSTSQNTTVAAAITSSSVSSTPASTSPSTTFSSQASSIPRESAATSTSTLSPTHAIKRISSGAIAGIAIGVVAGLLLVLGAAFLLWRHGKAQKARHCSSPAELDGYYDRKEVAGVEVRELASNREPIRPAELAASPNNPGTRRSSFEDASKTMGSASSLGS